MSLPASENGLARSCGADSPWIGHTRVPFNSNPVALHEHLGGHTSVALQLAFQNDFESKIPQLDEFRNRFDNVRQGHSEKDTMSFFLSFSAKATEKRMLAVLD
jgi:hypothetical protein